MFFFGLRKFIEVYEEDRVFLLFLFVLVRGDYIVIFFLDVLVFLFLIIM